MGIDPVWGSSAFDIVITQFEDGICQVLHAEEYQRPDYYEMQSTVWKLITKYDVHKIYIVLYANNLLNAFDFNQKPSPPQIVPLTAAELNAIRPFMNLPKTVD
jgi:hypothetical protein